MLQGTIRAHSTRSIITVVVRRCFSTQRKPSFAVGAKSRGNTCGCICLRVATDTGPRLVDKGQCRARQATGAFRKFELSTHTLPELALNASLLTI